MIMASENADDKELESLDIDALKLKLSSKIYQSLADIHNQLETDSNTLVATDVVLSALSINLGHIVGQLPPKMRKRSMRIINDIIKDQIIEAGKLEDIETYGQIGHA